MLEIYTTNNVSTFRFKYSSFFRKIVKCCSIMKTLHDHIATFIAVMYSISHEAQFMGNPQFIIIAQHTYKVGTIPALGLYLYPSPAHTPQRKQIHMNRESSECIELILGLIC
mmetsp:Transcript_9385/g.23110  ORF Transcript_9385/g.23110 Transcript_9385/m.23110 type:complete len:112 (-) Transcript_9385:104-439(-)